MGGKIQATANIDLKSNLKASNTKLAAHFRHVSGTL